MDSPFPVDMVSDITRFFKEVHPTLEPGRNLYDVVFSHPNFFPLQRKAEMVEMIRMARQIGPKTVMEIGSDKAGSLYHWCQCLPTVKTVIGCEVRGTPYAAQFEENFPDIHFGWTQDSMSRLGLEQVRETLIEEPFPQCIDVLFIDGDKSHFLTDFDNYLPMMNPKGIVFMHDIKDSPPRQAFEAVKKRGYETKEIIDISDYHVLRALGREPKDAYEGWLNHWKGNSCGVGVIYLGSK